MADTISIEIAPAATIQVTINNAVQTSIDYNSIREIINSKMTAAAENGKSLYAFNFTELYNSTFTTYKNILWPRLLSLEENQAFNYKTNEIYNTEDNTVIKTFDSKTGALYDIDGNLVETGYMKTSNEYSDQVGYPAQYISAETDNTPEVDIHYGACESTSEFAKEILTQLGNNAYSWLFTYNKNEYLPSGIIISSNALYQFTTELQDLTARYHIINDNGQVVLQDFNIAETTTESTKKFTTYMKSLFTAFNDIAEKGAEQGANAMQVSWDIFVDTNGNELEDMDVFLYGEDYVNKATAENKGIISTETINWSNDDNKNNCEDFSIYQDKNCTILLTDSWQTFYTEKNGKSECTILEMVAAVSDYYFYPVWSSNTTIGSILVTWVDKENKELQQNGKTKYQNVLENAQASCEEIYEKVYAAYTDVTTTTTISSKTAYVIKNMPTETSFDNTQTAAYGQYFITVLNQLKNELTAKASEGALAASILWKNIDSTDTDIIRTFWHTAHAWRYTISDGVDSLGIYKTDTTNSNKIQLNSPDTLENLVCTCLNAKIINKNLTYVKNHGDNDDGNEESDDYEQIKDALNADQEKYDYYIIPIYFKGRRYNNYKDDDLLTVKGKNDGFYYVKSSQVENHCGIAISYATEDGYKALRDLYNNYLTKISK